MSLNKLRAIINRFPDGTKFSTGEILEFIRAVEEDQEENIPYVPYIPVPYDPVPYYPVPVFPYKRYGEPVPQYPYNIPDIEPYITWTVSTTCPKCKCEIEYGSCNELICSDPDCPLQARTLCGPST